MKITLFFCECDDEQQKVAEKFLNIVFLTSHIPTLIRYLTTVSHHRLKWNWIQMNINLR